MLRKRPEDGSLPEQIVGCESESSLEMEVKKLVALLQSHDPQTFSPRWIQEQDAGLYQRLRNTVRETNGSPNWSKLTAFLDEKWQKRMSWWKKVEQGLGLQEEVAALHILLAREQPTTFNPTWIRKKDYALYRRFKRKAKNSQGTVDWSRVIPLLDDEWRDKMTLHANTQTRETKRPRVQKRESDRSLEADIQALLAILDKKKPLTFTPTWIDAQDHALYARLIKKIRSEESAPDWSRVRALVGDKWKRRFFWEAQVKHRQSLEKTVEQIPELAKNTGSILSPGRIAKVGRSLYERLKRRVRNPDGHLNWSKVTQVLDPDIRTEAWREAVPSGSRRFERSLPEQEYTDPEEVRTLLAPFKTKLYVFFTPLNAEDRAIRDQICRGLILLARKGNQAATEELIELLTPMTEEWMERIQEFSAYKHDPDRIRDRIVRCIHLFDMDSGASFTTYLSTSLKYNARGRGNQFVDSLHRPLHKDTDLTLLDVIPHEPEEEAEDNE